MNETVKCPSFFSTIPNMYYGTVFNGATNYAAGATLKCGSGGVDPKSRYTISTGIFLVPYACYVKIFVSLTTGTGANAAQPVIF